jgi:hypothetical protein
MTYCTAEELYSFLNLKIPFENLKSDLEAAIIVASSRINAQIGEIKNPDENLQTLLKRACMYYAGAEILRQYWEQLQIDDYEMEKIKQYEKMGDELTKTILNKLKCVQQVIDDENGRQRTVITSFTFSVTNR